MSPRRDMNNGPDDRLDALLRNAMHEEADSVMPAGDGLSRIQRRVSAGRARQRWLRPAMSLGSVAVLAALGVGVYAATNGTAGKDTIVPNVSSTPTASDTSEPTPSATTVPVADETFPKLAIFPFTSAADEKTWEAAYADGHDPWKADPIGVAQFWVDNYLDQPAIDKMINNTVAADGQSADVTLGRTMTADQKQTVPVTVVHLRKYGKGWVVVGASDPAAAPYQLKMTSPSGGDTVTSPVTVTGPGGFGVEESVQIDVRDATTPTSFGTGVAGFGNGVPTWSADVQFTTPIGPVGVVVGLENSQADGGPQRLIAHQVRFTDFAPASTGPQYFYAVKDQRIAKFASSDGSFVSYVTDAQPGGGATDPQLARAGGHVYYLQGGGQCVNALMSMPRSGNGQPSSLANPDSGYVISSYGVLESSASGQVPPVAYFEEACDASAGPQAKLVIRDGSGQTTSTVKFPSEPPVIVGDPSWEPDGTHVDAIVRGGTGSSLVRYAANGATNPTPSDHVCSGYDVNSGEPHAIEVDATGTAWFATQTGSSIQVVQCLGDTPNVAFTIAGNDSPADVDVTRNGTAVLVTDSAGRVWRWTGSGDPTELSVQVPLTGVTW